MGIAHAFCCTKQSFFVMMGAEGEMSMAKTRNPIHATNILLIACTVGCLVCYDILGGLWLKGLTSAWFVTLGIVNLFYGFRQGVRHPFLWLTAIGLAFGMAADVLLDPAFALGILFFAAGHVLYLVGFFYIERFRWKDLLFVVPVAAVSLYLVVGTPFIRIEDPVLKPMLLGYAVIIACMLGKALSNLSVNKAPSRWLIAVGSILFWFSDVMLAIDMFGTPSRLTWILCSYNYWPAQAILGYAMFRFAEEQSQQN